MKSDKIMNLVLNGNNNDNDNDNDNDNNNNDNTTQSKPMYENNHLTAFGMFQYMLTRQKSELPAKMQELLTEKEGAKEDTFGDGLPLGRKSPAEGRRKNL